LISILNGNSQVLISPYGENPKVVLDGWDERFKKGTLINELIELELANRSKFGPRSIAKPWVDRKSGVVESFGFGKKVILRAKGGRRNLRPCEIKAALERIKNDTNSGLPFYVKKGLVKDKYLIIAKDKRLTTEYPCVLFTRTQEQEKTRTVWGYPLWDIIREMLFYIPLLEYQKTLEWRSSLVSPDAVNKRMTHLIKIAKKYGYKLLSIDFSAYDTTVKYWLQKAAFDYIKGCFQDKYHDEIDRIFRRFNTIGLITPDGILTGPHGVPSGSAFTNEVDSIVQYLIATALGEYHFDIQGDDGAYATADPQKLIDAFTKYGLKVNLEKSYISDNYLVYLQCLYHEKYERDGIIGGIYPTYRALNRILFLERFTDFESVGISGKDYFSIRTICILENCKYHPLFRELVEYVYSLDKYKLAYTEQGLTAYIQNIRKSTGVQGILNFRQEDNVTGIKNFETVKILKLPEMG
jgi:hypothetical protein